MFRSAHRCLIATTTTLAVVLGVALPMGEADARGLEQCQRQLVRSTARYAKHVRNCLLERADRDVASCAKKPAGEFGTVWRAAVVEARSTRVDCAPGADPDLKPKQVAAVVSDLLEGAWTDVYQATMDELGPLVIPADKADRIAEILAGALAKLQRKSVRCYVLDDDADDCAADAADRFLEDWERVKNKAAKAGVDLEPDTPPITPTAAPVAPAVDALDASEAAADQILTGDQPDEIVDTDLGVFFEVRFDGDANRTIRWEIGQQALDDGADKFTIEEWNTNQNAWGASFGTGGRISDEGAPIFVLGNPNDSFCMHLIAHPAGNREDVKGEGLSGNIPPCVE